MSGENREREQASSQGTQDVLVVKNAIQRFGGDRLAAIQMSMTLKSRSMINADTLTVARRGACQISRVEDFAQCNLEHDFLRYPVK